MTITPSAGAKGQDNGAFLSILLTAVIAGVAWHERAMVRRRGDFDDFHRPGISLCLGQHLGAVRASAMARLNPLFSIMLGVLLIGEAFDVAMLIGMLLIGFSFAVLNRQSLKTRGAEQEGGAGQSAEPSWGITLANPGFFYSPVSHWLTPSVMSRVSKD